MSAAPTNAATGELVHIDPRTVIVGANVRLDTRLDKSFIDSIRERGVLVPIVGYLNAAREFVVLYGQRRTLASVEAERDTIPAYVVEGQDEADRLVDQMAENDHRASLTKTERAQGFAELVGLGLSAAEVAKRTATKATTVRAAVKVVGSEAASKALADHKAITIEQAAGLVEFEDDEDALRRLNDALRYGGYKHTLAQLRDDRDDAKKKAKLSEELRAQGLTVLDAGPSWDDPKNVKVYNLVDAADGSEITDEEHAVCPGHAVYADIKYDWIHPEGVTEGPRTKRVKNVIARAVCIDHEAHGHRRTDSGGGGRGAVKKADDMTEEEREAARAQRRDVIDSNKAWVVAEGVRREFLREFLSRKSAPRTTPQFIAATFVNAANYVSDFKLPALYADLLGVEGGAYDRDATRVLVENAGPDRAQVLALGYVLAGYELTLGTHSWRNVNDNTARYLLFLEGNGYELSDVEKRAAGTRQ